MYYQNVKVFRIYLFVFALLNNVFFFFLLNVLFKFKQRILKYSILLFYCYKQMIHYWHLKPLHQIRLFCLSVEKYQYFEHGKKYNNSKRNEKLNNENMIDFSLIFSFFFFFTR